MIKKNEHFHSYLRHWHIAVICYVPWVAGDPTVKFDDEKKFWLNEIWSIYLFFDWMLVLIDWSIDWLIMNFSSKSDLSSFMRKMLIKSKISNAVFNMNSLINCIKSILFLSYEKFSSNITFLILIIFLWLKIQIKKIFVLS